MTIREYLGEMKFINMEINSMLEKQKQLRDYSVRMSASTSGNSGKSNTVSDRVGDSVMQIVDLERNINEKIDNLVHIKSDMLDEISKVSRSSYRITLVKHYIDGKKWNDVATEMSYSVRSVKKFHDAALQELALIHKN